MEEERAAEKEEDAFFFAPHSLSSSFVFFFSAWVVTAPFLPFFILSPLLDVVLQKRGVPPSHFVPPRN